MDETKLIGNLPNVNVEITHRAAPDGSAEFLTINLTATPDFRSALPMLGGLTQLPMMMSPLALWTQAAQAMMTPWAQLARVNPLATPLIDHFLGANKK